MKNYLKYSMLMTLILMITIGLAYAVPIGASLQLNPFDSLPAAYSKSTPPSSVTTPTNMFDGDTDTSGSFYCSGTTGTEAYVQVDTFTASAAPDPIGWISIQVKYSAPGYTDDTWQWQYSLDAVTWTDLTAPVIDKFDSTGTAQFQSFSQLARPGGGTWTWTDIAALKVRVYLTRGGASWDGSTLKLFRIYDVWASVYALPTPPTSSPTMSLQAPSISAQEAAGSLIFVEIYCNDVTALAGWQYQLNYDPTVLTYAADYVYYPWTDTVPDMGADYVGNAGTIPVTDPLYLTGLTGNFAVARIYFTVNDDGTGLPVAPNFSWLRLAISFMGDPEAGKLAHGVYNGYYGTPPENTLMMGSSPVPRPETFPYGTPISTNWVEEYPVFGNAWHLTAWHDNGDTILSAGDTFDPTPTTPPGNQKFGWAVLQIWECNADPNTYAFMIVLGSVPEFPLGIGILLGLAPAIPVIYIWRKRPRKRVAA